MLLGAETALMYVTYACPIVQEYYSSTEDSRLDLSQQQMLPDDQYTKQRV